MLISEEKGIFDTIRFKGMLYCPDHLFSIIKEEILKLIKKNDFESSIKINISEVLKDDYCKNSDNQIYNILKELFEDYKDAYFEIKLEKLDNVYFFIFSETCMIFQIPEIFDRLIANKISECHSNLTIPGIENLSVDNNVIKKFCKEYKKNDKIIEVFRDTVLKSCKNFGKFLFFPENYTNNMILNENIKLECQNLCLFLLSVAKTCILFETIFKNNRI